MARRLEIVPEPDSGIEYYAEGELDEAGLTPDEWGDLTPNGSPRCKGVKANGKRCGSFRSPVTGFCFNHDPTVPPQVKRQSKVNGGRYGSKQMSMIPTRLRPVFDRLTTAMDDVLAGTLSPARAGALASLSTAAVRVLEAGEMEERMRKMEAAAGGGDDLDEGGNGGSYEGDDDA